MTGLWPMAVVLHGASGFLDELVIVVVGFGVLWLAVKLAGRKAVNSPDADEDFLREETATETETPRAAPPL